MVTATIVTEYEWPVMTIPTSVVPYECEVQTKVNDELTFSGGKLAQQDAARCEVRNSIQFIQ